MQKMRKIMDQRHEARILIVQELFAQAFDPHQTTSVKTQTILHHAATLDKLIERHAPRYLSAKIAKTDLSILRLAVYELTIEKKEPPKVIINEAIELAKELGGEKSPAFVNAVLGKVYTQLLTT